MAALESAGFLVPILIFLTLVEYIFSRYKKEEVYSLADTLVNISCGLLERLFDFFFVVFLYFLFDFFYHNVAPWHIPSNPFMWILALLFGDFLAYWFHRFSHEVNLFWAAHIVHHQSEELNMTTIFRVSAFAVINRTFFWIWMPIVGFSPVVSTSIIVFIGLYQFVTHTRLVGKLGIFEHFMVTPSHHRVHHARNEQYIDKNYGHVFIIWDKLFGTFEPEVEEPEYGIISGFRSSSPYRAYFSYWNDLFRRARRAKSWKNMILLFFKPPAWENKDVPHVPYEVPIDSKGKRLKYQLRLPVYLAAYVTTSLVATISVFVFFLLKASEMALAPKILLAVVLVISLIPLGPLMEQKARGYNSEILRLFLWMICGPLLFSMGVNMPWTLLNLFGILPLFQLIWLLRLKNDLKAGNLIEQSSSVKP